MNTYKNLIKLYLFCFISFAIILLPQQTLSDNELLQFQQLEKQLEEASAEIEKAVAQMSPEEQAEFHEAVAQMTQMFEGMSDEDFEEFLTQIMSDDFDESLFEQQFLNNDLDEEFELETEEVEKQVSLEEFKDILSLLENISKQINLFLVKISASPDLPGKLIQWRGQGKIKNWVHEISWNALKYQIELFSQTIILLQELDSSTKKARYLSLLKEDTELQEQLKTLNTQLSLNIAKIDVPEFGLTKLTPITKSFVQITMNLLTESLFVTKLSESFIKIEEKFGPEAKKIREKIEKQIQDASRSASRSLQQGKSHEVTEVFDGRFAPSSYSPLYNDIGGYRPSSNSYARPNTTSARQQTDEQPSSSGKSPKSSSGNGSSGIGGKSDEKDEKEADEAKEKKELEELRKYAQEKQLVDTVADEKIQKIVEKMNKIKRALESDEVLGDLKNVIKENGTDTFKKDIFVTTALEVLPSLHKLIGEVVDEIQALYSLRIETFTNKAQKEHYKKSLITQTNKYTQFFTKFINTVNGIEYESTKLTINAQIRWLLFKDALVKDILEKNPQTRTVVIEYPQDCLISLLDFAQNLENITKKIKNLEKDITVTDLPEDCLLSEQETSEEEQEEAEEKITVQEKEEEKEVKKDIEENIEENTEENKKNKKDIEEEKFLEKMMSISNW